MNVVVKENRATTPAPAPIPIGSSTVGPSSIFLDTPRSVSLLKLYGSAAEVSHGISEIRLSMRYDFCSIWNTCLGAQRVNAY